jgi:serine/threonine protein phosphatase PrpC
MNIHSVSLKGLRDQNEDKHNIILNGDGKDSTMAPVNFLAVFDGHGGKFISKFLSKNIQNFFINPKVKYPLSKKYVNIIYNYIQNQLREKYKMNATNCGSTALLMIHYKRQDAEYINILNTGDSRCVLCRDNIGIALTKDHKPNWPEEKARIEKLGGKIYFDGDDFRIKDLSVSRAFGDIESEPFLTNIPDIFRYKLDATDKFIVLACDGVWDVLSNQEVVNFVLNECYDETLQIRKNKTVNVARKLGTYAIQKGSTDNITIVIMFFKA